MYVEGILVDKKQVQYFIVHFYTKNGFWGELYQLISFYISKSEQ
jgi:hypothetical protein